MANFAMANKQNGGTLTPELIKDKLQTGAALQFYFDGGFVDGLGGSAGVQLLTYVEVDGAISRTLAGFAYLFVPSAKSAFQMELLGLTTALTLLEKACLL